MDPAPLETLLVLQKTGEALELDAVMYRRFRRAYLPVEPRSTIPIWSVPDPAVTKNLSADSEKWGHLSSTVCSATPRWPHHDPEIAGATTLPLDRLRRYIERF